MDCICCLADYLIEFIDSIPQIIKSVYRYIRLLLVGLITFFISYIIWNYDTSETLNSENRSAPSAQQQRSSDAGTSCNSKIVANNTQEWDDVIVPRGVVSCCAVDVKQKPVANHMTNALNYQKKSEAFQKIEDPSKAPNEASDAELTIYFHRRSQMSSAMLETTPMMVTTNGNDRDRSPLVFASRINTQLRQQLQSNTADEAAKPKNPVVVFRSRPARCSSAKELEKDNQTQNVTTTNSGRRSQSAPKQRSKSSSKSTKAIDRTNSPGKRVVPSMDCSHKKQANTGRKDPEDSTQMKEVTVTYFERPDHPVRKGKKKQ